MHTHCSTHFRMHTLQHKRKHLRMGKPDMHAYTVTSLYFQNGVLLQSLSKFFQATETIRAGNGLNKETPIVAVTANDMKGDVDKV